MSQAVVHVIRHEGEVVFKFGKIRFDALFSYDALPLKKEFLKIRVFRAGRLLDTGRIEEFGTHGASHMFFDLQKIAIPERPYPTVIGHHLRAEWFEVGDEVRFAHHPKTFRKILLGLWYDQLRGSLKYKLDVAKANDRREEILKKLIKKAGGMESIKLRKHAKFIVRILAEARRKAFADLDARFKREPLPSILRVQGA